MSDSCDPSYATLSFAFGESHYLCNDENHRTTVRHQNDSSNQNKFKTRGP